MSSNKKIELGVGVDANPARAGLKEIEQAAQDMAQAVGRAGQQAGKGLDGIGAGGDAAAQKLDRTTKSIISSVQRATVAFEAGGRNSAKYFELIGEQRGANASAISPYIEQLKQAERAQQLATGSLDKMGLSAKQTAFALRGVPAQFTDIITSLQSGQAPLTVLLQQGGQLKDMFGGVGNAAKALGGYVVGLINPFTLAAAAAGALAVAYYQGSKEAEAYNKALILTGNAAGTTAAQMQAMASRIDGVIGTQAAAAAGLALVAGSGKVAAKDLEYFTTVALKMEREVGTAVKDTVKQFAELGEEPVKASLKLNESYNYLTLGIYEQIKALKEQGKEAESAALAQKTYADALSNRAGQMTQNLGAIERAWRGISGAAKDAWDAMLSVGRVPEKLKEVSNEIEIVRKKIEDKKLLGPGVDNSRALASLEKELAFSLRKQSYAQEEERMTARAASNAAKNVEINKAGIAAADAVGKANEKALTKQAQMNKALDEYRLNIEKIRAADPSSALLNAKTIADAEKGIRDQFKVKGGGGSGVAAGESEVASIRAKILETQKYIDALKTQGTDALKQFGLEQAKLNEGEKLALKIKEELQGGIKGVARANKEKALAEAEALGVLLKVKTAEEQRQKTIKKSLEDYDKLVEGVYKSAESLEDQAQKQEAANAVFGKGALAIDALTLATLKYRAAEADSADNFGEKYTAALQEQVKAQERLNIARSEGLKKSMGEGLEEWARVAEEQAKLYQDELALSGLTGVEREKIVAARQVELRLAQELSKIDKSGLDDAGKEELRIKARNAAQIEGSAAVAKVVQEDWAKTAATINNSITDALMRSFESGKDFAKNLRGAIVDLFKNLVLRPEISGAVNQAASYFGLGKPGAAAGGGSSILGAANNASSLYSAYSQGASAFSVGTQYAAGTMSAANAGGTIYANLTGGGLDALFATNAAYGTAPAAAAGGGSAMSTVAAAIPYAAVALIVANALGVFRSKKIVGSGVMGELGSGDLQSYDLQRRGGTLFNGPSYSIQNIKTSPESQAIQDAYTKLRDATSNMADTLGVGSESIKTFTTKLGTEVIHSEVGKTGIKFDGLKPEEITKKVEEALLNANEELAKFVLGSNDFAKSGESASQTLQRLSGSLGTVNNIFGDLGFELKEASLAGGDAASNFIDLFGGIEKLTQATGSYYENFYSEAERTANSTKQLSEELQKLGVDGLPATRDGFRKLVDEAFGAGNEELGASLIKLSPVFAQLTQKTEEFGNVASEAAAAAEKIANEAKSLNNRLLQAQGDVAALRQQEIDSLDESNQAILKHIFAIEDKAKADADAAALAEKIGSEAASLNTRLMQAEGDLAGLRKEEINAVDESNRALLSQVLALEKYNEIHAESEGLVTRLLQVQGNTVALRERERSVLHESNQVLFDYISMLEDQAKATELLGRLLGDFAQYGMSDLEKKIQDIDKVVENSITSLEEWNQASYDNILAVERWADASRKAAIAIDAIAKAQSNFDDLGKAVEIEREALSAAFDEVQNALQAEITKFSNDLSNVKGLFARSAAAERTSLTDAANTQKSALQKQIDAMNGVSDASEKAAANLHSVIDALTSAVDSLRGIDALQKSNYADAVGQIDKMLLGAQQGIFPDAKDLSRPLSVITGNTSDSYASSFDFNRDQLVQAAKLEELSKLAGKELGFEDKVIDNNEKQLEALQAQIKLVDDQLQTDLKALDEITKWGEAQFNALEGIDASIVTMDEAQKAVAELTGKYQDDQVKQIEKQMKQSEDEHKKSIAALNLVYQAGLMQINQLNGVNSQLGSAVYHLAILSQSVQAAEQAKKEAEKAAKDVPGFASGGDHTGGWRIVGEKGPELEFTGPAKYYDAAKTKDMLRGESSSDEVRQLREDNRAQASAMVSLNARLTKLMERWDRDGMPAVRTEDA